MKPYQLLPIDCRLCKYRVSERHGLDWDHYCALKHKMKEDCGSHVFRHQNYELLKDS